jgi:hypothetical protein
MNTMFKFGRIPGYLIDNEPPTFDVHYCDDKLECLKITPPTKKVDDPWLTFNSGKIPLESDYDSYEDCTIYDVYVFARGEENMVYWSSPNNMFFAYQSGNEDPILVACTCGHPYVAANGVSWHGSHGSTDPPTVVWGSPDELLEKMCSVGERFVGGWDGTENSEDSFPAGSEDGG